MQLMDRIKVQSFLDMNNSAQYNFILSVRRTRSSSLLHDLDKTKKKRITKSTKTKAKPKVKRTRAKKSPVSSVDAAMKALSKLPPAMREAMLKQLQGS